MRSKKKNRLTIHNSNFQFATYEKVSQVPRDIYTKGIELKGIVRAVYSDGLLKVEHKPLVRLPMLFSRRKVVQVFAYTYIVLKILLADNLAWV